MKRQTDPYGKVMKKETKEQNRKIYMKRKYVLSPFYAGSLFAVNAIIPNSRC